MTTSKRAGTISLITIPRKMAEPRSKDAILSNVREWPINPIPASSNSFFERWVHRYIRHEEIESRNWIASRRVLHSQSSNSLLGRRAISWFESRSPHTLFTRFLSLLFWLYILIKKKPGGRPVGATSYRQQGEYGAQS